jgi:heat shock protein HslJ
MRFNFSVAVCAFAVLLAGCAEKADAPTPVAETRTSSPTPVAETGTSSPTPVAQEDFSTLAGAWVLSGLEGGSADADSPITMALTETGEFSGSAGCNRYFGKFVWTEGKLGSGLIGSTMMACEEPTMALEQLYLGLLPRVAHIIKTDGRLQLLGEQDQVLVEMLAENPAR